MEDRVDADERVERLLQALDRARSGHRGAKGDVDVHLGHQPGYLTRVFSGGIELDVRMLFRVLETLGLDPGAFLATAVGTGGQLDAGRQLEVIEKHGRDRGPAVLDRVESIIGRHPTHNSPSPVPQRPEHATLHAHLRELDELRFSDPARAHDEVLRVLDASLELVAAYPEAEALELVCKSVAALGSSLRIAARLSAAARCFRLGLAIASGLDGNLKIRGALLQRSAYLLADDGEYEIAAEIAMQAVEAYLLAHDLEGVGKALVTRGIMVNTLGDSQRAIHSFDSSLHYLGGDTWYYRASAFHGLGVAYFYRNQLDAAARSVERAKGCYKTCGGLNWGKAIWLEAEIALKRRDLATAERSFRCARETFEEMGDPLDFILISVRLSRVLLMSNQRSEIGEIATSLMAWSTRLRSNKIARAAIDKFILAVLRGEISISLLETIERQIERAGAPGWGHPHGW